MTRLTCRRAAVATGVIVIAVAVITLSAISILAADRSWALALEAGRAQTWLLDSKRLELRLRDAEAYQRQYLLSGDEDSHRSFVESAQRALAWVHQLRLSAEGDENRRERLSSIGTLAATRLENLQRTAAERRSHGLERAVAVAEPLAGAEILTALRFNLSWIQQEEDRRLRILNAAQGENAMRLFLASIGLATAALAGLLWLIAALVQLSRRASGHATEPANGMCWPLEQWRYRLR